MRLTFRVCFGFSVAFEENCVLYWKIWVFSSSLRMSTTKIVKSLGGKVKPVLSLDPTDARRRVLNLYRSWYRQVPYICYDFDLPVNEKQLRDKVREKFYENKNLKDIRVIDMMVVRGQMELNDTVNKFKSQMHVMAYFKDPNYQKPKDFLSKFLSGHQN